jgi:CPA2 family monovalent cation:H+ antiporter-2
VGTALDTFHVPYVVIEVDPDIVETLRSRGTLALFGDATHERILQEASVSRASLAVLTLPEGDRNRLATRNIRRQNPSLPILARSHSRAEHDALLEAGASEIIQPELEASATTIRHALRYLKLPPEQAGAYLERFRSALETARVRVPEPSTALPDIFEFEVDGFPFANQSLRQSRVRERFGVTVVAVVRPSGEVLVNPQPDTLIASGDKIRIFGLREQVEVLNGLRHAAENERNRLHQ